MFGFSRGLTVALGAAALTFTACQRQDDASRRQAGGDAVATQRGAEQSSERAADAQERAAEERDDVASAQEDVAEKQKDLAEARGEASKETGEAQQAEQQAGQATRDAQQQSASAQATDRQATAPATGDRAMTGDQAPTGQAGELTATGQVVRASDDELVLRQAGEQELKLKVSDDTPVMMDGRQASVSELKEGTQVRASYQEQGGTPQAIRIEAQGSGAPSGTGTDTRAAPGVSPQRSGLGTEPGSGPGTGSTGTPGTTGTGQQQ